MTRDRWQYVTTRATTTPTTRQIDALARKDRRADKHQQDRRAVGFALAIVGACAILVALACAGVVA